jgi:hypothetical protein
MKAIKFYRLFLWLLIVEKKKSFPAFSVNSRQTRVALRGGGPGPPTQARERERERERFYLRGKPSTCG